MMEKFNDHQIYLKNFISYDKLFNPFNNRFWNLISKKYIASLSWFLSFLFILISINFIVQILIFLIIFFLISIKFFHKAAMLILKSLIIEFNLRGTYVKLMIFRALIDILSPYNPFAEFTLKTSEFAIIYDVIF